MFERLKEIVFRMAALNQALKTWETRTGEPYIWLNDYCMSEIQKVCFIGADLPSIPEEVIAQNSARFILPETADEEVFGMEVKASISGIRSVINSVYMQLDAADKKILGEIDYRLKEALAKINQNNYED